MAYDVPSIAARSSSLPEIGGDAALYFDPTSPRELERAIEQLLSDRGLCEELIARGKRRVAEFRWDVTAEQTLAVMRKVSS